MDGRGRLAQPLTRPRQMHGDRRARAAMRPVRGFASPAWLSRIFSPSTRFGRVVRRHVSWLLARHIPRGAGALASALLLVASATYGAVAGGHIGAFIEQ